MNAPRLPFEPLAAYVGRVDGLQLLHRGGCTFGMREPAGVAEHWYPLCPARAVAVALGDTTAWRRAAERWKRDGLTLEAAERVVALLRCTPWDIWPVEYGALVGELEPA